MAFNERIQILSQNRGDTSITNSILSVPGEPPNMRRGIVMPEMLEMTNESVEKNTLGKCWVALLDAQVVGIIAMTTPNHTNINFDDYRERALHCLTLLGETKAGDLVDIDGKKYFAKNITHKNRGKGPRKRNLYPIAPWVLSGLGSSDNKIKSPSLLYS